MALGRAPVAVDLERISYQRVGDGEPLILIHGLAGSKHWWMKNIDRLAERFQVYAIDLIGCGDSQCGKPFVLDEAAACLVDWMDYIGIDRANLVGHSMGGFVAADLAADFSDRVDRLILVDAAVLLVDSSQVRRAVDVIRSHRYTPRQFLPVLVRDAQRTGLANAWNAIRQILNSDLQTKLSCIQSPTLLLWGEYDTIVPPALGQQLAEHLANAQLVILPSSGHYPMWDHPETFNQVVLDFLESADDASIPDGLHRSPVQLSLG